MRLFEAIVDANHRALDGDERAGVRPADFPESLPIVVLTCFDPRMHPLMPEVLGVAEPDFIWVTNAGNVVTGPLSSTARSLALACGIHDGKEIAVVGHTDCRFFQPVRFLLAARLQSRGIVLGAAAAPLDHFLRQLVDEHANVRFAVESLRASPLIPRSVPVHGLLVDSESGRLEWLVNGYDAADSHPPIQSPLPPPGGSSAPDFRVGGELPPIGGP
jgi:carbonic anhydrase